MFYGWIPTNKGKIEYEYINVPNYLAKYVNLFKKEVSYIEMEIDLDFFDDSFLLRKFYLALFQKGGYIQR